MNIFGKWVLGIFLALITIAGTAEIGLGIVGLGGLFITLAIEIATGTSRYLSIENVREPLLGALIIGTSGLGTLTIAAFLATWSKILPTEKVISPKQTSSISISLDEVPG